MAPVTDSHSGVAFSYPDKKMHMTEEPYRKYEPGCKFGLQRLQLEADLEYLMVEGCDQI